MKNFQSYLRQLEPYAFLEIHRNDVFYFCTIHVSIFPAKINQAEWDLATWVATMLIFIAQSTLKNSVQSVAHQCRSVPHATATNHFYLRTANSVTVFRNFGKTLNIEDLSKFYGKSTLLLFSAIHLILSVRHSCIYCEFSSDQYRHVWRFTWSFRRNVASFQKNFLKNTYNCKRLLKSSFRSFWTKTS